MPCPTSSPAFAWDASSSLSPFSRARRPAWLRSGAGRRRVACRSRSSARVRRSRSTRSAACGCFTQPRWNTPSIHGLTTTSRASCWPSSLPAAGYCSPEISRARLWPDSCSRARRPATCSWRRITAAARRCRPISARQHGRTGCSSVVLGAGVGQRSSLPIGLHRAPLRRCCEPVGSEPSRWT